MLGKVTNLFTAQGSRSIPSLLHVTLDELAHGLDEHAFTSVDLVTAYLARIEEANDFHAIIEVNPDAMSIARALDTEREQSGRRSILHGIPIILKDTIITLDRMEATAGSAALLGAKPASEGTCITKLREAGAILLGKAALTEWSNARWTNASTGWSARGGQCTGPFYPNMKASGSSTGPAVGTTLSLAFAGIATETDGSILNPAGKAAVVGVKPTTGLVARDGVIPISFERDTIGPMAKTVKDAASILSIISGRSQRDQRTWDIPFEPIPDYAACCNKTDLKGVRIGVPRNAYGEPLKVEAEQFEKALSALQQAGVEIVENADLLGSEKYNSLPDDVRTMPMLGDFRKSFESYLDTLVTNPHNIRTMTDLIDFTKRAPEEDYPARNVAQFETADSIGPDHPAYREFLSNLPYFSGEGGISGAIDKWEVDALVVPTSSDPIAVLAAIAGSPAISMPLGFYPKDTEVKKDRKSSLITTAPGIPYPVTFYGKRFSEGKLLAIAHVFEQVHGIRSKGQFYKSPVTDLEDVVKPKERI